MHKLMFDPETHTYTRAGVVLPSVTQVLDKVGMIDTRFFKPHHARRGQRVHAAIHKDYLSGGCVKLSHAAAITGLNGYVRQWRRFVEHYQFYAAPENFEHPLAHSTLNYAGTPDYIGAITVGGCRRAIVIDIKSGQRAPSHAVQLAAYVLLALQDSNYHSFERMAVYVSPECADPVTGLPRVERFPYTTFAADVAVFKSALNVFKWRVQHGKN